MELKNEEAMAVERALQLGEDLAAEVKKAVVHLHAFSDEAMPRLRHALDLMSQVNQWLGQHDGHVQAVTLGQAMRDVRWVLVGLEGGAVEE